MNAQVAPLFLTVSLLLTGTAAGQSGTLEIAIDQSPVGLDPHVATAFSTFAVIGQIYDGLLELNRELELEPALAESWAGSDDGLNLYLHTAGRRDVS